MTLFNKPITRAISIMSSIWYCFILGLFLYCGCALGFIIQKKLMGIYELEDRILAIEAKFKYLEPPTQKPIEKAD